MTLLQDTEFELSKLDQAIEDLKNKVQDLTKENAELRPLVDRATNHSEELWKQANLLDRYECHYFRVSIHLENREQSGENI